MNPSQTDGNVSAGATGSGTSSTESKATNLCTRCRKRKRTSMWTGCLCDRCEIAVQDMTQAELNADYEQHRKAAS